MFDRLIESETFSQNVFNNTATTLVSPVPNSQQHVRRKFVQLFNLEFLPD